MVLFNGFCNHFEPLQIQHLRRLYSAFADICTLSFLLYILYTVATAPKLLTQQEDVSQPNFAVVPNIYISYQSASGKNTHNPHNPHITIDCEFLTWNSDAAPIWVPRCAPWLQNISTPDNPFSFAFRVNDSNLLHFGNDGKGIQNIVILVNFTTPADPVKSSYGDYYRDGLDINIADPLYDPKAGTLNENETGEANYFEVTHLNDFTLDANEMAYFSFRRTFVSELRSENLLDEIRNRLGINTVRVEKAILTVDSEYHAKPKFQPRSVFQVQPSTYIVSRQKETYTITLLTAIGSLNAVIALFTIINFFLFGSSRLRVMGYLHRRHACGYQQLLREYGTDYFSEVTFEAMAAKRNISEIMIEQGNVTTTQASPSISLGTEIKLRMLSLWPERPQSILSKMKDTMIFFCRGSN